MIPSSVALPVAFGERPLVRPLGQRQVAGQEPLSARRSEGQPGYLGASRAHLHLHRAPITATQPMDIFLATGIRVTVIPRIDIRLTRPRGMDTQVIPALPVTPVPRPMDTRETRDTPLILLRRPMDTRAAKDTPLTPVPQPMNTMAMRNTRPTRQAMNKAMEDTRLTLVPLAMNTRTIWGGPLRPILRLVDTGARRLIPLTPFPVMDLRDSLASRTSSMVKHHPAMPHLRHTRRGLVFDLEARQ